MPVPMVVRPSAPSISADTAQDGRGAVFGHIVSLAERDLVQRRAPPAAPGRQERDRLQQIGLAGAVMADQHHRSAAKRDLHRPIAAKITQAQAEDPGGGHSGDFRFRDEETRNGVAGWRPLEIMGLQNTIRAGTRNQSVAGPLTL
jgi:hypothetical protein